MAVQIRRELVTPNKALLMLKQNSINRRVNPNREDLYAGMMAAGQWNYGHNEAPASTIKINCDGTLLDGGTRLAAVVKCGKPQWFWVERGAPVEVGLITDGGRPKTTQDRIRMWCRINGVTVPGNLCVLATALNVVIRYKTFVLGVDSAKIVTQNTVTLLEYFKKYRASLDAHVKKSHGARDFTSHGLVAAVWLLCAEKEREAADAFFTKLIDGKNISTGEPVGVLRARLILERARPGYQRVHANNVLEWLIKAWNATQEGIRWTRVPTSTGPAPRIN